MRFYFFLGVLHAFHCYSKILAGIVEKRSRQKAGNKNLHGKCCHCLSGAVWSADVSCALMVSADPAVDLAVEKPGVAGLHNSGRNPEEARSEGEAEEEILQGPGRYPKRFKRCGRAICASGSSTITPGLVILVARISSLTTIARRAPKPGTYFSLSLRTLIWRM